MEQVGDRSLSCALLSLQGFLQTAAGQEGLLIRVFWDLAYPHPCPCSCEPGIVRRGLRVCTCFFSGLDVRLWPWGKSEMEGEVFGFSLVGKGELK